MSGTLEKSTNIIPTKQFQPTAVAHGTDVARIADLHLLVKLPCDEYETDDESNNLLDMGSVEG